MSLADITPSDLIQEHLLWVQIAIGLVQLVTTIFFILSVRITGRQEKDVREQIDLAREQTKLARDQMKILAVQSREALRPLLIVTSRTVGNLVIEVTIRNDGLGPALDLKCEPAIGLRDTVVGSKASILATVTRKRPNNDPTKGLFTLSYKSVDDYEYATSFVQDGDSFSVARYWTLG